ncbi:MAG: hypothetical protein ACM33B_01240 [Pseudomonadota bacterium]
MTRSDLAGWLLLGSFLLWLPAAALPSRVWTAPLPERLALIAPRRRRWQVVNLSIVGAAVLLVLGFAALAEPLERAGGGVLVPLSSSALLMGAPLWLASLTFRVTSLTGAADAEPQAGFAALSAWAGGLFLAWTALANAAVLGFGAAVVHSGYPAAWSGWVAIVLAALMLAQLAATGDALPALYHVAPAVIGIALLLD